MFTPPNMSRVTCHVSHVACHVSHFFFFFFFWTKWWSLSVEGLSSTGLPRLVYEYSGSRLCGYYLIFVINCDPCKDQDPDQDHNQDQPSGVLSDKALYLTYYILNSGILKSNSSIFPWSKGYITQYTP